MTKKSRTILFYSFLLIFLLIAPVFVLYSQGYRFDFDKLLVVQTGGLFIKADPKQTQIFIDGKLAKKTDFFAGSALISNLLPKKYQIRVEKEGYFAWEKTLEVREKEVAEAKLIVLFPENPNFTTSTQTIENIETFWDTLTQNATSTPTSTILSASGFTFKKEGKVFYLLNPETKLFEKFFEPIKDSKISPDSKKLVFYSENEIWIFFSEDASRAPRKTEGEKMFLTRFSEKIGDVFWLNSDYLIFNTGNKIKITEMDNRDRINIYDLGEFNNPRTFWSQPDKKIYVLSEGNVYVSDNILR